MKDLKKTLQFHALYVLLTQECVINGLLKAVISIKPLQAHINISLGQPEEFQFICLSWFCLCPSPACSARAPGASFPPPQLTGAAGWSSLCSTAFPFPEREPSFSFQGFFHASSFQQPLLYWKSVCHMLAGAHLLSSSVKYSWGGSS